MIRSEPLLPIELEDSLSDPNPDAGSLLVPLLIPIPMSIEGMV
ncbi:MAG TPA: hypothetical protein VIT43_10330 [Candidatus Dormibacteraeota bacterium]